jgi:release factor glutamine methyltransferase
LAGIDSPRLDARLLLAHALGTTPDAVLRDRTAQIDPVVLEPLLARRQAREPLALILGRREFWSLDFSVSPATLIPRPESETLIEATLVEFTDRPPPRRILDLGTGTGCLLLAALAEFPGAFGIGIDRSPPATTLAAHNAAMLNLADRAAFLCGDWAAALDGQFDLILCNPPYIPSADLSALMPEVACYEPRAALDGGCDGFSAYRALVPNLPRLLAPDGIAVLELGAGQAETADELARDAGFVPALRRDLSGIARALVLKSGPP